MRSTCDAWLSRLRTGCWRPTPEMTPTGWPAAIHRDPPSLRQLLERYVPPAEPATAWLLCDVVCRMTRTLVPLHEEWVRGPMLGMRSRRPFERAVKTLRSAAV